MIDNIIKWWKGDKGLLISIFLFLGTLIFILTSTIHSYFTLQKVQGNISYIYLDMGHHTQLKIRIASDTRLYYQQYESRFHDNKINKLHTNDKVSFYTLKNTVETMTPLFHNADQIGFSYYPIFYVNNDKGILQIFYFYVNKDVYGIIFFFTGLLVLYNGFPIILSKQTLLKIPLFLLAILMAWLAF